MHFSVPYTGKDDGLFAMMRQINHRVSMASPEHTVTERFCGHSILGKDIYSIVDGNESTAWANDVRDPKNTHFYVDIGFPFNFGEYSIKLLCSPPKAWEILGSNNNLTWTMVDKKQESLLADGKYHFRASFPNTFRYFCFNQTRTDGLRLHIHSIEFFSAKVSCSFKIKCNNSFISFLSLISFLQLAIKS